MSEFSKLTMSGNIGEASFTLRGDSGEELIAQAADLAASLDAVYEELAKAKQVVLAKEVFSSRSKPSGGFAQGAANSGTKASAPSGGSSGAFGHGKTCKHGEREYKEGVSKAGNAYKLYACTAPRNEQCPAEYVK